MALTPRIIDALENAVRPITGEVWLNKDGTLLRDTKTLTKDWNSAMEGARVRYRRPYNCRHTRASLGLSAGQTPAWLANQLGHDMRTFFAKYATYIGGDTDAMEMAKLRPSKNTKLGDNWEDGDKIKPK